MDAYILLVIFGTIDLRSESFKINHIMVEITISEYGYFDVREIIEVDFSKPRHGITRTIPLIREGNKIEIDSIQIAREQFKIERNNTRLKIKIGKADELVYGTSVYEIRYRVSNAIKHSMSNSEFYWNIVGSAEIIKNNIC